MIINLYWINESYIFQDFKKEALIKNIGCLIKPGTNLLPINFLGSVGRPSFHKLLYFAC